LAGGETVRLSNGGGDTIAIELITNLPDYELNPPPNPTSTVRVASNPFGLVVIADRIYVTDGGRNLVWQVDVPTGISTHAGQLLVTLFRGFPFPAGTSSVEQIDPTTGSRTTLIDGLKTAIDVLAARSETVDGLPRAPTCVKPRPVRRARDARSDRWCYRRGRRHRRLPQPADVDGARCEERRRLHHGTAHWAARGR
jgi:hypothetical protein